MAKQDRQGVRKAADLERKYSFEKRFKNAMDAAADAKRTAEEFDEGLDAEEVFNRLTENGKQQGIYRENGKIYINGSYIKAGNILASLITAGILQSADHETFYLDLENGILKGKFTEFSVSGKTVDSIAQEKADTAQSNSNKYTDDKTVITKEYADTAAKNAVAGQTQEDVFNKLTNDGQNAGIYILDGELYINASYLVSGILQSADKETFYLDLANNVLKGIFTEATIEDATIAGKKVSWKQNDSGEYVLIGE